MRQPNIEQNAAGAAFLRFALALYARPGVAEALIALQDRAGRDVNLILFGLWLGAVRGHALDTAELARAEAAVAPIRLAIVEPLRRQRRRLKGIDDPDVQALRRRIVGLEIAAERRAQYRLAAAVVPPAQVEPAGDRLVAAEANLTLYLGAEAHSAEADLLGRALRALVRRSC